MKYSEKVNKLISTPTEPNDLNDSKLELLFENSLIFNYIKEMFSNDKLINMVLKKSYFHYNGFFRIVLASSEYYKVRLHFWDAKNLNENNPENIHDHRWTFSSKILMGSYISQIYIVSKDPQDSEYYKYLYDSNHDKDSYNLKEEGVERLKLIENRVFKIGENNSSNTVDLHRVIPTQNTLTASLMVQGQKVKDIARVYNENKIRKSDHINMLPLSRKQLKDLCGKLLYAI